MFDHLEGETKEEIKHCSSADRGDPVRVIAILQELYSCSQSYVALQEALFSRKQQEGETLQEFSLALMSLMERLKQSAPMPMLNAEFLLRDQFVEHVLDSALRRELKHFVCCQPAATLLEVRGEAIRWEREGMPSGVRSRSFSLPSVQGTQYEVQGRSGAGSLARGLELAELREMLRQKQDQLNHLTQSLASLRGSQPNYPHAIDSVICRRCQQPGHYARQCDRARARS